MGLSKGQNAPFHGLQSTLQYCTWSFEQAWPKWEGHAPPTRLTKREQHHKGGTRALFLGKVSAHKADVQEWTLRLVKGELVPSLCSLGEDGHDVVFISHLDGTHQWGLALGILRIHLATRSGADARFVPFSNLSS